MIIPQNKFYIKYCKFFNQFSPFKKIGNLIKSEKLLRVANYLNENYNLIPNEVMTTAILNFILVFIPLIIIFSQINIILGIFIPIIVSYVIAYKIFNHPIVNYNKIQLTLLQYSDLAFQDLLLILNTTNSIFDAIYYVSMGKYPILSERFKNIIFQINFHGKSPESLIVEFINELPNGNLKERLLGIIATKFQPNKILKQMELLAGEKKFEYEVVTRQLESKLIIIIGVCLFFPIVTALFVSFLGFSANYLSFLMIIIFIVISNRFKTNLMRANFKLFGDSSGFLKDEKGTSESELLEFLHFLTFFANELKLGIPQEIALLKSFRSYQGSLKNSFDTCIREIYSGYSSFKQGWNKLKQYFGNSQIKFLFELTGRMLEKSAMETGNRITSIVQQIKANRELIKERESIIKAQQFKIKFLTFIMAAILGLIAGLVPLLFQISIMLNNPEVGAQLLFWESFPLAIALLIMVLYASFFLTKLVRINKAKQFAFWSGVIFCSLWYLTYSFL